MEITLISALLSLVFVVVQSQTIINVLDYGAVGDGNHDDTEGFLRAWGTACSQSGLATLVIPPGKTFLLDQISFSGPCKSEIQVQVSGNLVAPNRFWVTEQVVHWISFIHINDLTINGPGRIDGQGSIWWDCKIKKQCNILPYGVGIFGCNNFYMNGLEFINSPGKHLTVTSSSGVHIKRLKITAPGDSPNTDGIYIQDSQYVEISDTTIGTGDDCIAIGTGSLNVNVTRIKCGPGHGISIGSLGYGNSEAQVQSIHVSYSNMYQTQNGMRIKTWQGGSGFAKDISFQHMNITSVQNPIIIDQFYCPSKNCMNSTSAVKLSDVRFAYVIGTSASKVGIKLACSGTVPCSNIILESIHIDLDNRGGASTSYCLHAQASKIGNVIPDVSCLI